VQAEAANEAQRGGIEQAKGQWWASRAALASGFTVPPSGLSVASAVLDAFRDRSMVVAGENRRARDQCADHECQRYDLSCHSIPRMAALRDLGAGPLRPARTLDVSGAYSPSSTWKSRVSFAAEAGRSHGNAVPVRSDFPDATCRSVIPDTRMVTRPWWFARSLRAKERARAIADIIIAVLEVNRSHER